MANPRSTPKPGNFGPPWPSGTSGSLLYTAQVGLIRLTEAGSVVLGKTGPDRAIIYALAAGRGLRSAECQVAASAPVC